jgi:hypothetical protein
LGVHIGPKSTPITLPTDKGAATAAPAIVKPRHIDIKNTRHGEHFVRIRKLWKKELFEYVCISVPFRF